MFHKVLSLVFFFSFIGLAHAAPQLYPTVKYKHFTESAFSSLSQVSTSKRGFTCGKIKDSLRAMKLNKRNIGFVATGKQCELSRCGAILRKSIPVAVVSSLSAKSLNLINGNGTALTKFFKVFKAVADECQQISSSDDSIPNDTGPGSGSSVTATPTPKVTAPPSPNLVGPGPTPTLTPTPTPTPPPAGPGVLPTNLVATALGSNSVQLVWSDNSTNEIGFRVERRTCSSSSVCSATFTEVDLAPPNTTVFIDSTAQPAANYQYQIKLRLLNSSNQPYYSTPSAPSNIVTTLAGSGGGNGGSGSGVTPTPTVVSTPPPGQPAHLATHVNELYYVNQGATEDHPAQFGRLFVQGEIANYPQAIVNGAPVLTQADIKTRWPDGSVKHAILSFIIPNFVGGSSATITFQNQATGNNAGYLTNAQMLGGAYNFDAAIELTNNGNTQSASARSILSANPCLSYLGSVATNTCRRWLEGSVSTSVILVDHSSTRNFDIGFDSYRSFRPMFLATFWPALNKVKVRFIGEISNTEYLQDMSYDLNLKLGFTSPQTVYSKIAHYHHARARWTKEYWLGGNPSPTAMNPNIQYLVDTGVSLKYDASLIIPQSEITTNYSAWMNPPPIPNPVPSVYATPGRDLGQTGGIAYAMGNGGDRPDIGVNTAWAVQWLYTGDSRSEEIAFGTADLSGSFPMHYREGKSGRFFDRAHTVPGLGLPVTISSRPSWFSLYPTTMSGSSYNSATDVLTYVGPVATNPWVAERAHTPDFWFYQYLFSGDFWYLEEGQFWATWLLTHIPPNGGIGGRHGEDGLNPPDFQIRGQAWTARCVAIAAVASPDGTIEKSATTYWLNNMLGAWEGERGLPNTVGAAASAYNFGVSPGIGSNYSNMSAIGAGIVNLGGPSPLHFWGAESYGQVIAANTLDVSQVHSAIAIWMQSYMMVVQGYINRLGFQNGPLVDWLAQNYTGQLNDPANNIYTIAQYRTGVVGANNQWFTSWSQVMGGFIPGVQTLPAFSVVTTPPNQLTPSGADPYTPGFYPAVHNGAINTAVGMSYDQVAAATALANWSSVYSQYYLTANTPDPRWAILP